MKNKILVTLCTLLLSVGIQARDVDGSAVIGGMIGAGVGAAVGSAIGGTNGAIIGGGLGGAVGAAAGSRDDSSRDRGVIYDRNSQPIRTVNVVHTNNRYYDEPIEYNRQHRSHRDMYNHRDDRRAYYRDDRRDDRDHRRDDDRNHRDRY